jgi:RNA polymerase sigma-70 factor (ECF subfamily)
LVTYGLVIALPCAWYHLRAVDDFALLQRWNAGDKASGNELFERHFAKLRRFFRNKVDDSDAEDLVGRTLLECVRSLPAFRGEASFRTYLFTIARRELGHHIRRKLRDADRREPDFTVSSLADLGLSPSRIAAHQQVHDRILAAMQQIPLDFQITLELHYWEGLNGPELAEVLGIAPTTVRTRLHRAREALRERLRELGDEPTEQELEASITAIPRVV